MSRPLFAITALAVLATCSGSPSHERSESSTAIEPLEGHAPAGRDPLPAARYLTDRLGEHIRVQAPRAAGATGKGVAIAIVDSGLDLTHEEFRDPDTKTTRVKWLIDYGMPITGRHLDIETKFGIANDGAVCAVKSPPVCFGAVFDAQDIDALLRATDGSEDAKALQDTFGHGTHVAGIAAGGGASGIYRGVAPEADLLVVRPRKAGEDGSTPDAARLFRGIEFAFDRGRASKTPVVVNLSVGFSLGAPDQNDAVSQRFSTIGKGPGEIIVASAGNDGFIGDGLRQTVHLTPGSILRVPVELNRQTIDNSSAYIAANGRDGAAFSIGIDTESDRVLTPSGNGNHEADTEGTVASLVWDPERRGANRALVWLHGSFSRQRRLYLTLEGSGTVSLALLSTPASLVRFPRGTTESTITSPGALPQVISVGCTVNRTTYRMQNGRDRPVRTSPALDPAGGIATTALAELQEGAVCPFSGAGPAWDGSLKPEVVAPGFGVISARSAGTTQNLAASVFLDPTCVTAGLPKECALVSTNYGVVSGTSMSAPVVAGEVALMLQRDPTLTQESARNAVMAGVHRWRGPHPHREQAGTGEVDVALALEAVDRMKTFREVVPVQASSWSVPSASFVRAGGDRDVEVLLLLRGAQNELADLKDVNELRADVAVNGVSITTLPKVTRRGPGLFSYRFAVAESAGPGSVAFGARFRGSPVVPVETLPIAADWWAAKYPSSASSACTMHPHSMDGETTSNVSPFLFVLVGFGVFGRHLFRRTRTNRS